jgi:hypothetical protein
MGGWKLKDGRSLNRAADLGGGVLGSVGSLYGGASTQLEQLRAGFGRPIGRKPSNDAIVSGGNAAKIEKA